MAMLITSCGFLNMNGSDNRTVGRTRLNIETYLAGKDQPTHPSVVCFDEKWNGYKYWMSYTPYPEANGEEENPCIAVSNDLYKWETPYGMVNPIADNEETGCAELKDSHILYRNDLNRLEVWYLGRVSENIGGDGTSLTLFRKCSKDGVNWSDYEVMDYVSYLSPTVFWDGQQYKMWSIGFDTYDTTGTLVYQESLNGTEWSNPQKCSIDNQSVNLDIWHGSVFFDEDTSKYLLVYLPNEDNTKIEFCVSDNGIEFTENKTIVNVTNSAPWKNLYRPTIMVENGIYHLFYGVVTEDNKWYISYSKGEDVNALVGITNEDAEKMASLDTTIENTKSIVYKIKQVYGSMRVAVRFETGVLVILLLLVNGLIYRREYGHLKLVMWLLAFVLCFIYTSVLLRDGSLLGLLGILCVSIVESVCIYCVFDVVNRMLIKT